MRRIGFVVLIFFTLIFLLVACESKKVDVKKIFEVQGEVIGLEFQKNTGIFSSPDRTMLGLKSGNELQSIELQGLHPEFQIGGLYKIWYSKLENPSIFTFLIIGDSCKLEKVELK